MFLISVQWLSFLILEMNFFADITIVVTHSEVVELWRIGVMCGEMEWCMEKWGEAHERALCAQAFSRAWDLISALCRYSHFLATFKWNFVNLFSTVGAVDAALCVCLTSGRNGWHGSAGRSGAWGCSITDARQQEESSCSELCFLEWFALHSCYLYTFGFLCILIVCSSSVTLVSVSPLSSSIFPFAAITLFAAWINQITNNRSQMFWGLFCSK